MPPHVTNSRHPKSSRRKTEEKETFNAALARVRSHRARLKKIPYEHTEKYDSTANYISGIGAGEEKNKK